MAIKEAVINYLNEQSTASDFSLGDAAEFAESLVREATLEWAEENGYIFDEFTSVWHKPDVPAAAPLNNPTVVTEKPLSLEEFRASRTESPDVRMLMGFDDEKDPIKGYVYANGCGVIQILDDGRPYLMIYNNEWIDIPLEEMEEILYQEFYLPEVCGVNSDGL